MVLAKTHDKKYMVEALNRFLTQFQECFKKGHPPRLSEFQKFLSSDFNVSSNNISLGKNLQEYLNRIIHLQKKYAHLSISELLEAPLICDNKIVTHYDLDLTTRAGQKKLVSVMAIATMEDDKFTKWIQLTHEKGTGLWDDSDKEDER